jgi:hypothetical protein
MALLQFLAAVAKPPERRQHFVRLSRKNVQFPPEDLFELVGLDDDCEH